MTVPIRSLQIAWISVFLAVFTWSAVNPHDYPTWFLEVFPAVLGAVLALLLLGKVLDKQLFADGYVGQLPQAGAV